MSDTLAVGSPSMAWARMFMTDDATMQIYQIGILNGVLTISPVG